MPDLVDLDGVKQKRVPATVVGSVSGALRAVVSKQYATASGSEGALNVYRADDGTLRAEFMRYMVTLSKVELRTKAELRAWLKAWWPELGRR